MEYVSVKESRAGRSVDPDDAPVRPSEPKPAAKPAPISSATPAATKGGQSASTTESDIS